MTTQSFQYARETHRVDRSTVRPVPLPVTRWESHRTTLLKSLTLILVLCFMAACGGDKNERAARIGGGSENPPPSTETEKSSAIGEAKGGNPNADGGTSSTAESSANTEGSGAEHQAPSYVGGLGMVLATSLHVRSGAGMENPSIGLLSCGDVVRIEEQQGEWYRVKVEDVQGWSHMSWLNPIRAGGRMPKCGKPEWTGKSMDAPREPKRNPDHLPAGQGQTSQAGQTPDQKPTPKPEQKSPEPGPKPTPIVIGDPPGPQSGSAGSGGGGKKGKGPESILLAMASAKPGKVTFPHHPHNQQFECAQCHHAVTAEIKQKAKSDKECRSCHPRVEGEGISPVKSKDAFHTTCRGCHQTSGAGPTKCAECHVAG